MSRDLANLQQRIAGRLRSLSANDMQRLAEELALTLRPSTFNRATLIVQGRNLEDQTRKGWPDAYAEASGGRVYGIEATRQKLSWEAHVEEDYNKAANGKNRNLAGYFFVGGYPDHEPTAATKASWIDKFMGLGIQPNDISLLVGLDLVSALLAPECARIRRTILHLTIAPRRFVLLRPGAVGSTNSDPSQPSREDYENRRVFEPLLLAEVVQQLRANGQALIRGHGAAGKTTLAHLLTTHPDIDPRPVYYADLGSAVDSPEVFRNEAAEDFAEFAGSGVTFVLDNIHLAEPLSRELAEEWRAIARPVRACILLLGRERRTVHGTGLGDLKPLVMRAGAPELRGVVSRLLSRGGHRMPPIPNNQMREWISIFGGDPGDPRTSVDLIAFSAAAVRRISSIAAGNFHLKPSDAVDGVRARYWSKIKDEAERSNLIRLAALAVLEIAPSEDNLPRPDIGFPTSSAEGLVLSEAAGGEGRLQHRLAHPALGSLLLHAVGVNDNGRAERLVAAKAHAPLAFRLAALAPDAEERQNLQAIATGSVAGEHWLNACTTLHDTVGVARALLRVRAISARELDTTLSNSSHFERLLAGTRTAGTWILFLSMAKQRNLVRTLRLVHDLASRASHRIHLFGMFAAAPAHLAATCLRLHPSGGDLLEKMDVEAWTSTQGTHSRAIFATETASAVGFFESRGRADIARAHANQQVLRADARLWFRADLTHLSHILRVCKLPEGDISNLLDVLSLARWLETAVSQASSGSLAGSLLSLSNHLPDSLLHLLPTGALRARVQEELMSKLREPVEPAVRALSMLGAVAEVIPGFSPPRDIIWPSSQTISAMISARVRKDTADRLGTHEIQLWLGIMRMAETQTCSVDIDLAQGERVLRLLASTKPPSARAEATRARLLTWLQKSASYGWRI